MRDRLIELLSGKSIDTDADVEYLADYLLKSDIFNRYEAEIERLKAQIAVLEGWGNLNGK